MDTGNGPGLQPGQERFFLFLFGRDLGEGEKNLNSNFLLQNKLELNPKFLRSAFIMMTYVLLIKMF